MPELPEVETIKRDLERKILGQVIKEVSVYDPRVVVGSEKSFVKGLTGLTIVSVSRRSKALIIGLENGLKLVVHLKMTGQLIYGDDLKVTQKLKETKVVFRLSNNRFLNYNDQRIFGRLWVVKDLNKIKYFQTLGPEPLEKPFTSQWLIENLKEKKRSIKAILLDQSFVSGIGNIYASEILFDAHINPQRLAGKLKPEEINSLHKSIIKVLKEAIKLRGTSMRNYRDAKGEKGLFKNRIKVYDRENELCLSCGQPIERIVQNQRSTYFCKHCQE